MALIDREKLLEFAHNHIGGMIDCNDIARFPAVDAEPVRRGRWEGWHGSKMRKDGEYQYFRYHSCSECERRTAVKSNYCPNCGARMEIKVT